MKEMSRSLSPTTMTAIEETKFEAYTLGAATFDLSGLPKEYYTLVDGSKSIIWVQPIFQALGLKSLLAASLPVENFTYAVIYGCGNQATRQLFSFTNRSPCGTTG
jgi:hypothetical protein